MVAVNFVPLFSVVRYVTSCSSQHQLVKTRVYISPGPGDSSAAEKGPAHRPPELDPKEVPTEEPEDTVWLLEWLLGTQPGAT